MTQIAQIGAGRMGSALTRTFAAGGNEVAVWNLTPAAAEALVGERITYAPDLAQAVSGAELIVSCIHGYKNLENVLADAGDLQGRTLVNFVGGVPDEAKALAAWAAERGLQVLEGEIMVYPQGVGAADARIMYSGNRPVWERFEPTLRVLGGESVYISDDPGAVGALQSAGVGVFYCIALAGFLEATIYAQAHGLSPAQMLPGANALLDVLREAFVEGAEALESGNLGSDQATIDLYRISTTRASTAMHKMDLRAPILDALREELVAADEAGNGKLGFFGLGKTLVEPDQD
jgi:3-hydroxyisobutyrate dehydrogenase-like beta-hydroxyacid dehydrogenase